jgi:hypothetical protein
MHNEHSGKYTAVFHEPRTIKRCAFCGGRLGLISYRKGRLRFCKRVHRLAYLQRQREQQKVEGRISRWFVFLMPTERAK